MARFISPISGLRIVAVHEQVEVLASGLPKIVAPGYTAEFQQSDVTEWEREYARQHFQFRGTAMAMDGSPLDPLTRVSAFDSLTIKDEALRKRVEQALLARPDYGKADGFAMVERPRLPAPFPAYDAMKAKGQRTTAEVIVAAVREGGYKPSDVLAYERQEKDRPEVIEALEQLAAELAEKEPESEPLVAA